MNHNNFIGWEFTLLRDRTKRLSPILKVTDNRDITRIRQLILYSDCANIQTKYREVANIPLYEPGEIPASGPVFSVKILGRFRSDPKSD